MLAAMSRDSLIQGGNVAGRGTMVRIVRGIALDTKVSLGLGARPIPARAMLRKGPSPTGSDGPKFISPGAARGHGRSPSANLAPIAKKKGPDLRPTPKFYHQQARD